MISAARLLSAPLTGWLVLDHRFGLALAVTLLAAASDWLDGWAARHFDHGQSDLGTVLDPIADKVFLITLFLCCGPAGLIPIWLVSLVLGRDLVIVAGSLLIRWRRGPVKFLPLTVGKVSTFFQILSVLLVLLYGWGRGFGGGWGGEFFASAAFHLVMNLGLAQTAFFTALSGAAYVQRGIEIAREQGRGQGTGVRGQRGLRRGRME